jgi:hypothetical protein
MRVYRVFEFAINSVHAAPSSKPPCSSIASFKSGIIRFFFLPARFVCQIVRTTRNSALPFIIRA